MADVFREVDEDLRREQLQKLWDRYAPYVLGLAVLIVLAVSGYKLLEFWQRVQAETSGDRFVAAMNLMDAGKDAESINALQAVAREGSGAYPVLALFAMAAQKADSGDQTGAVADFDAIAARGDVPADIKTLARLRAAYLLVDTTSFSEVNRRIGDLAAVGNPWHSSARELLALSAWREGNYADSSAYFNQIGADQEAPADMRQRAQVMLTLIAAKQSGSGAAAPSASTAGPATPATPDPAPAAAAGAPAGTPPS